MTEQMMSEGAVADTGAAQPDASSTGPIGGAAPSAEINPLAFNRDILPEDLRLEPSLQSFDSVDKLAKSYVHAVRKLGVPADELVRMPKEMTPEHMAEIYERLGRPNSADEYVLDGNNELTPDYKKLAHEIGLSQQQAQALHDWYNETVGSVQQQQRIAHEQAAVDNLRTLQQEWKGDFSKNADLAQRAFKRFADESALQVMNETGLGNHPSIVKMFHQIGRMLAEDGSLHSGEGMELGGMSATMAQGEINNLMNNGEFMEAYLDQYHPRHAESVRKMKSLYEYL